MMKHMVYANILAICGIFLFALNTWGLLSPNDLRSKCGGGKVMSYSEAKNKLEALKDENDPLVVSIRATEIISRAMDATCTHQLPRIPVRQNYLLYIAGYLDDLIVSAGMTNINGIFTHYRMTDADRGLRRGVGKCGQQAIVLAGIVSKELGWETDIVGLGGHIVTQFHLPNGKTVLADPLHNIVLDMPLQEAEQNIETVIAVYGDAADTARTFNPEGNTVIRGGPRGFNPKLFALEKTSYILIWLLPILMILPRASIYIHKRQK